MSNVVKKRYTAPVVLLFLFFTLMLLVHPRPAASGSGEVVSGPYSLTIRGGSYSDSATFGGDARADFINPFLNTHLFGTYDQMDASSGLGLVDTQRYGAGFALSHTYQGKANLFLGTSFINELNKYFGHAYIGGKVKVLDNALLSASYGQGIGPYMHITKNLTRFITAKSVNWLKAGAVYVAPGGIKTNLYYYLTDPGGVNISGLEGKLSYPVAEAITVGIIGSGDLTEETNVDRHWSAQAFATYAFGSQTGAPIDVALDTNNPVAYPMVIYPPPDKTPAGTPPTVTCAITISPTSATIGACSEESATFTAIGGVAPYFWSTDSPSSTDLTPFGYSNSATAVWHGFNRNYCEDDPTHTVTVVDDNGCSATATVKVRYNY